MADDPKMQGHPHASNWFFNLLGLYDRTSRPVTAFYDDLDLEDTLGNQARAAAMAATLTLASDRSRRIEIFEEMDSYGLVSAILDVYAEEATQPDYERGRSVWIESKASHMVEAGNNCLHNCQVEDRIAAIARRTLKYGDAFQRLLYATEKGVLGWRMAPSKDVAREEDKYGRLVGFRQNGKRFRAGQRDVSWPWDYVHFRMLGKDDETGYGTSLLHNLFSPWRRMVLTEEAILMYRLRRMPDRNMVMVNVGNMDEVEAMAFVNSWRKKFRKHELVDPASPNYRKQYNPLTPLEDIFIPMIDGREHRVETLSGAGNIGDLYDLEHFRDSFFGAAKVPKAYFGFEGEINAKATLMQQDVRFARTAKRVQRSIVQGLRQLLDVHFTLIARPGEDAGRYDVRLPNNAYVVQMSPISYLDESQRLELVQLRNNIVDSMANQASTLQLDPRMWATYVLLNYAKLPEEIVLKLIQKTPDAPLDLGAPPMGAPAGMESKSQSLRATILDQDGSSSKGFYPLSEAEQKAIARIVHESPQVRRSIAWFAELYEDDKALIEAASRQTDSSLVPPISASGLADTEDDSESARQLFEDRRTLERRG